MAVDTLSPGPVGPVGPVHAHPAGDQAAAAAAPTSPPRRPTSSTPSTPSSLGAVAVNERRDASPSPLRFRSSSGQGQGLGAIRRVSPIRVTPILPANRMSPRGLAPSPSPSPSPRSRGLTYSPSPSPSPSTPLQLQGVQATASAAAGRLSSSRLVQLANKANGEDEKERDVSQCVERLTALAKETMARVDRITAESSAAIRRSSGTPPVAVSKNVVIVSKTEQEASCASPSSPSCDAKPVSILKRKSSHEESAIPPPVTFSPIVVSQPSRRHGILKKTGGSLDESHLRRSCSPETETTGSILKNRKQRRSSLEENCNRQSILKRKDVDDGHEPHSILKKKSPVENGVKHTHISIADHVIMAANGDMILPSNDEVRPILKKKSSAEEQATADPACSTCEITPRPILKKKSSTETDELEDWPKKTILKSSRQNSREEAEEGTLEAARRRSVGSSPVMRSAGLRLSFSNGDQGSDGEELIRRRISTSRSFSSIRPTSPSGAHSDFSSVAMRRRSWESHPSPSGRTDRPLSVAERISNMEGFYSNGAIPKQPSRSRAFTQPVTYDEVHASSSSTFTNKSNERLGPDFGHASSSYQSPPLSPVVSPPPSPRALSPTRPLLSPPLSPPPSSSPLRPSTLFLSSPKVDSSPGHSPLSEETNFSFKNHVPSPLILKDTWASRASGSKSSTPNHESSPISIGDNWILKNRISSPVHTDDWVFKDPNGSPITAVAHNCDSWDTTNESGFGELRTSGLTASTDSDLQLSYQRSPITTLSGYEDHTLSTSSESTMPNKLGDTSRAETLAEEMQAQEEEQDIEMEKRGLQRSASRVSEKALLFSQMEEKMKQAAEEARARRLPKAEANQGIARYRNRKSERAADLNRFSTQPITVNEKEDARSAGEVRTSASAVNLAKQDETSPKDRFCSVANRIKIFRSLISNGSRGNSLHTGPRFKTQPVTSEEISESKDLARKSHEKLDETKKVSFVSVAKQIRILNMVISKETKGSPIRSPQNRNRRKCRRSSPRFSSQPVTIEEVLTARGLLRKSQEKLDESEDENDPSKLSLAERVKLFNKAMTSELQPVMAQPQPPNSCRRAPGSRFKTQPVTIEEVSTAQNIIKLPQQQQQLIETGAAKAAKEMFEKAAKNLSKSVSCSRMASHAKPDTESPKRGILKNSSSSKLRDPSRLAKPTCQSSDDTDSDDNTGSSSHKPAPACDFIPVRRESESESLRHIKSVLMKERAEMQKNEVGASGPQSTTHKPITRRQSCETASGSSSSESDNESNSDAEDEGKHVTSSNPVSHLQEVEVKDSQERSGKPLQASFSTLNNNRPLRADNDEKVWNLRNRSQEKENQETQNILSPKAQSPLQSEAKKGLKIKSEENKKLPLKKLEALSKPNETSKRTNSKDTPVRSARGSITSDDGETSSGGQEVRRIISNDAVARRHQANIARQQANKEKDVQLKEKPRPKPGHLDVGLTQRLAQQLGQLRLPGQPLPAPLSRSRSQHAPPPAPATQQQQEEGSDSDSDDDMAVHAQAGLAGGLRRCLTQPMPHGAHGAPSDVDLEEVSISANASIADRLKLLQKNGQTGWRKRVSKPTPGGDVAKVASVSESQQVLKQLVSGQRNSMVADTHPELVALQKSASGDRSSILADRLGKLENASQDWRKRVDKKDAEQFSVKGKMMLSSSSSDVPKQMSTPPLTSLTPLSLTPPDLSPGADRRKKVPKPVRFRSKAGVTGPIFKRSLSAPGPDEDSDASPVETENGETPEPVPAPSPAPALGPRIEVPRLDDDSFDSFFNNTKKTDVSSQKLEIRDEDLDLVVARSSELLVQKRTVRVTGRRLASRNPVKALAARKDLCNEYIEQRTGVAEREMKRLRAEKLAKHSSLAVEALAGLASKEDFSAVSLRKSASTSAVPNGTTLLPYKEIMLLQIKGRRHVQTRLVEPSYASINSGDNFVLVTPSQVFNFVGRYSNVIECARGAEIAAHVQQNKDLGFSGTSPVITVSEERSTCTSSQTATFWRLLGSLDGPKSREAGHPDEDELYETAVLETNIVYELQGAELVPLEKYWGSIPKIEMLDPSKILVFDFGSEMYIWNGKNAPLEQRKVAQQLSRELWDQGYDYTDCDLCPVNAATALGPQFARSEPTGQNSSNKRPSWTLIAKVTQHMETVLFREKFLDWPDFTRVIRARSGADKERVVDASVDVKPCDAKEMFDTKPEDPDLLLEGSHLGRGNEFYDEETRRFYEIQTTGVKVWHVQEYDYSELPESAHGQFHTGDSYVVRWAYRVTVTTRALSGQPSKHAASQGRDRYCYFCWQGRAAPQNEKGAAALLTVELDKERGPQVFVTQGLEPPAFLGLFGGSMTVHAGRRQAGQPPQAQHRLFAVRGEAEREASLVEVTPSMRQLRSRACMILVNAKGRGRLHVWHGVRALPHVKQVAMSVARRLQTDPPAEFGLPASAPAPAPSRGEPEVVEEDEGAESSEFFKGVGGTNRHLYAALSATPARALLEHSPRMFQLTSLSGTFTATEVNAPCRNSRLTVPYPFQQSHLYSASQPALFLLEDANALWLWQGWWSSERDEEDGNAVAGGEGLGSGAVRWQAERRAAMQTALDYWALAHPSRTPRAHLVWAGLEPLEFTNLFVEWTDRDDIAKLSIQDGHKAGEVLSVQEELARLTQSTYPPAQLLQRPLPDGVDPTRLELYLAPQHFQEMLGMSKEEFLELPQWKQTKVKKEAGLF